MTVENPSPLPEVAAAAATTPATAIALQKTRMNSRFTCEAILIALSMLPGFGVSEWRQAQVDQELAEHVRNNCTYGNRVQPRATRADSAAASTVI